MNADNHEKLPVYWQKRQKKYLAQGSKAQEQEEQEFLETQYAALRTEIEQASDRAFKIFAASVLVVPTGLTLGGVASADNNVLPVIKMLLPLLLLAFYAMYSAQMFSTYRAGLYIESHLEPRLLDRTQGWESWLSDRRYAYDAQVNVAFFSLSVVYYLGTAYLAATANVAANPILREFEGLLNFRNQILPVHILSSVTMLFIFYGLAGLVMFYFVQLVPRSQLMAEERIEQRSRGEERVPGTPEDVQAEFLKKLNQSKFLEKHKNQKKATQTFWWTPFNDRDRIKSYYCNTETARHVPKARHVRLTIGKGLESRSTVVGLVTIIVLLLWAVLPIHRFYNRLAQPPSLQVDWIQPPSVVWVLAVVSLLVLSGLLLTFYYPLIGRNIGAKIDIRFRLAEHSANGDFTRYIVQSSLDEKDYEWLREMVAGIRMKAIVYTRYGPPEVLELKEVAKPIPRDDEVLIKVQAVSVNRSDWEGLRGKPLYARIGGLLRPRQQILGSDIAGRVEMAGRNVSGFQPGDEVFGDILPRLGGFAEYVCAPENKLAPKPASMTFEEAAAIPQSAVIALQGIRDKGQVQPGQKVLVNGAGGGAGAVAVQLAKLYGAEVTGVDNTGKLDFMRSLGADHVIDYTREDFTKNGKQYDLILDIVAHRSVFAYKRALRSDGRYFLAGGSVATVLQILLLRPWISMIERKKIRILAVKPSLEDMVHVTELYEAGNVTSVIDKTYPLSKVPEAIGYVGDGHAQGKVVITV